MEEKDRVGEQELFNKAICFATARHAGQCRKGSNTPYIVHPLEVLQILHTMGGDLNLLMAGVLHDTVEDTDTTLEELAREFNEDVADLVGQHSEDKSLSWEERKSMALAQVAGADKREQMLVLADKLSNIRAMARDYQRLGKELWQRFHRPRVKQAWYYKSAIPALARLGSYADTRNAYQEFVQLVEEVFQRTDNIRLTAEELADRSLVLYQTEEQGLYWELEHGCLTVTGEDYDSDGSYEYSLGLNEETTQGFFKALHRDLGDEPLEELVPRAFGLEGGFYKIKSFLDGEQLQYEYSSF